MTVAIVVILAGIIPTALLAFYLYRTGSDNLGGVMTVVCLGLVAVVGVFMAVLQPIVLHFDRVNCNKWHQNTGREILFKAWNDGYSDECYTRTSDGKGWIPTSQLRDVAP